MVMVTGSCEMEIDNDGNTTVTIPKGTEWYHLENRGPGSITVVLPEGDNVKVRDREGKSYIDYLLFHIQYIHDISATGARQHPSLMRINEICDEILGHEV